MRTENPSLPVAESGKSKMSFVLRLVNDLLNFRGLAKFIFISAEINSLISSASCVLAEKRLKIMNIRYMRLCAPFQR